MSSSDTAIVLDANILIRAVLGRRVRELILTHAASVGFFAPDAAYEDARKYLPALLAKRGMDPVSAMQVLNALELIVRPIESEAYAGLRQQALQRIGTRDADDLTSARPPSFGPSQSFHQNPPHCAGCRSSVPARSARRC